MARQAGGKMLLGCKYICVVLLVGYSLVQLKRYLSTFTARSLNF